MYVCCRQQSSRKRPRARTRSGKQASKCGHGGRGKGRGRGKRGRGERGRGRGQGSGHGKTPKRQAHGGVQGPGVLDEELSAEDDVGQSDSDAEMCDDRDSDDIWSDKDDDDDGNFS